MNLKGRKLNSLHSSMGFRPQLCTYRLNWVRRTLTMRAWAKILLPFRPVRYRYRVDTDQLSRWKMSHWLTLFEVILYLYSISLAGKGLVKIMQQPRHWNWNYCFQGKPSVFPHLATYVDTVTDTMYHTTFTFNFSCLNLTLKFTFTRKSRHVLKWVKNK